MFCRKCGNQFDNSLDFCPKCNEPIPEAARKNRVSAAPQPAAGTVKCPQCLCDNKPGAKFCAACGYDMSAAAKTAVSPEPAAQEAYISPDYSGESPVVGGDSSAAAKPGLPFKAIIIGAAAFFVLLIGLLFFLLGGSGSKEPVPALLKAADNLIDEVKSAKGMHIELDIDGDDGTIDYQLNIKKKEFIFYMESDGEEMGGYIFADEGRVTESYRGDYYTEKIKSSDAKDFWSALEGKNYEDNDFLTDYFDKKEVNKAIQSLMKGLNSKDFQNDFAEALEIEYEKKNGAYTYSAELNAKNVGEAMEVFLDMVEDRTKDYAEREFDDLLDECYDDAKEIKSEGKSMSLGDLEWVIKKGKLQSFEYEYEYYDSYWEEEEKFTVSGDFEYGFGGLKSVEISGDFDGEKFEIEISDIGEVDDVKGLMSKSMLKELKLDK